MGGVVAADVDIRDNGILTKDSVSGADARGAAAGTRVDPDTRRYFLLICDIRPNTAGTILDHIAALDKYSDHSFFVLNNLGSLPENLDLSRFDGIFIHYSIVISIDHFLSPSAREAIRDFMGFKAVLVQDDYRWIDRTVDALRFMRVNALFGLAGQDIIDQVYSPERLPGVRRETVLAGYATEALTHRRVRPFARRRIDVGYRGRVVPAWLGQHGQEKRIIAERFAADAAEWGLRVDIAYREEDRIYGDAWIDFIAGCKAVLGCEGGASVCDFTGEIQTKVEAYEREHPDAGFEEIRDRFFKDIDGKIMMNVGTPRCFEAAALRTLMILYEGEYSGIVTPWRHYVPLKKDHGNMAEVVAVLRDPARAEAIIDAAYNEVALNPAYTFKAMVEEIDRVIDEVFEPSMARHGRPYRRDEFARAVKPWGWLERIAGRVAAFPAMLVYRAALALVGLIPGEARRQAARRWLGRLPGRIAGVGHYLAEVCRHPRWLLVIGYKIILAILRVVLPRSAYDPVRLWLKNCYLQVAAAMRKLRHAPAYLVQLCRHPRWLVVIACKVALRLLPASSGGALRGVRRRLEAMARRQRDRIA